MTAFEIDTFESTIIGTRQTAIITFSEVVTGLMASDFSASGATILFFGDVVGPTRGSEYGVFFRPTAATFTLTLAADSVIDADGNTGPAAEPVAARSVDGTAVPADTTAPTVTTFEIDTSESIIIGTTQTATITFSEVVTGLTERRFNTSTGVTGISVSGSGDTYTITFTPSAATFRLTLARNSVVDTARLPNPGPATVQSVDGTAVLSADANLSSLTLSVGTLSPEFDAATLGYTVNVANDVASTTVTPTTNNDGASVTVDGDTVESAAASNPIALTVGANAIVIVVTAADTTEQTYTVTVRRAPAAPSLALAADTGSLPTDRITNNGRVNVTALASGAAWRYTVNGGAVSPTFTTGTGTFFTLDEGDYAVDQVQVVQSLGGADSLPTSLAAVTVDETAPEITRTGAATVTLTVGDPYTEQGASATDNVDTDVTVTTDSSAVLIGTAGTYIVTYNATDVAGNDAEQVTRTVIVQPALAISAGPALTSSNAGNYAIDGDTLSLTFSVNVALASAPSVTIAGQDAMVSKGTGNRYTATYVVASAQVTALDGALATYDIGAMTAASNPANTLDPDAADSTIRIDVSAPEITLNGDDVVRLIVGDPYTERNATATDDVDTDVTVTTDSSAVLIDTAGTYTVTYNAMDAAGNEAVQVTRTVIVSAPASTDADLVSLTITDNNNAAVTLDPTFDADADTVDYTASVDNEVTSVTVTPGYRTGTGTQTVTVNLTPLDDATTSVTIDLTVGVAKAIAIVVTAEDGTTEKTYTVTVTRAANTAPRITNSATVNHRENAPITTIVATYRATDAESHTITWSISGADADDFTIVPTSGALTFNTVPNYEDPQDADADNDYQVTVTATDNGTPPLSVVGNVTVVVTNTDEEGTIAAITGSAKVGEQLTAGAVTDPDSPSTPVEVTAHLWQNADGTEIPTGIVNAATYTPTATDEGKTLQVIVTYTDGHGPGKTLTSEATAAVQAADATESSDANLSALTLSEGTLPTFAAATTAYNAGEVANDVASVTVTPTTAHAAASVSVAGTDVTSGTPSAAIPLAVGANNIGITVTAEDASTKTYTVTITRAANSAPVIDAGNETLSAAENSERITTFTATDADTITWTLGGTDAGLFFIDRSSGRLSFTNPLDYETPQDDDGDNIYEITLTATDNGTPPASSEPLAVTVMITNVDETGRFGAITGTLQVGQTLTAGAITDPDSPSTPVTDITYQWQALPSGSVASDIGSDSSTYTLTENELNDLIQVIVTYTDGHGSGKTLTSASTGVVLAESVVLSADANLSALTISAGTLPTFAAATISYTVSVGNDVTSVTVTPSTADAGASVTVAGTMVVSGTASGANNLDVGATAINIIVTAADGTTTKTYTVTVTRAAPTDTTAPTATFGAVTIGAVGTQQTVSLTFSEAVTGLTAADITATGATVDSVTGSGDTWTINFTPTTGTFTLTLAANSVMDTASNMGSDSAVSATGTAVDATAPEITLLGASPLEVNQGTTFTDPGATATDDLDGDLSASIVFGGDTVDTDTAGDYTITYDVSDDAGNAAETVTRIVRVVIARDLARLNEVILPEVARAMAEQNVSAITQRLEQARLSTTMAGSASFGGASSLADIIKTQGRTVADDQFDLKRILAGSDFVMPLNANGARGGSGGDGGYQGMTFWGAGDYRDLKGADEVRWGGDFFSLHLGLDAQLSARTILGVSVSSSQVRLDYTDPSLEASGDYDLDMTSVHPYLGWTTGGLDFWATLGYGEGELEISENGGQTDIPASDLSMQTFGVGASGILAETGLSMLRLKTEILSTELEVDASEEIAAITQRASRLRLALEATRNQTLSGGGRLESSLEVGARQDSGDGETGAGAELGGSLLYTSPGGSLTMQGKARVLVAGKGDAKEWGLSGVISLSPSADGSGLSFSLTPGYGVTASSMQQLWQQGLIDDLSANGQGSGNGGANSYDYSPTLDVRLDYGMNTLRGPGLITPYTELSFGDRNIYRLGLQWQRSLLFELKLVTEREESGTSGGDTTGRSTTADHRIYLEGELHF